MVVAATVVEVVLVVVVVVVVVGLGVVVVVVQVALEPQIPSQPMTKSPPQAAGIDFSVAGGGNGRGIATDSALVGPGVEGVTGTETTLVGQG